MIAWILAFALVVSIGVNWAQHIYVMRNNAAYKHEHELRLTLATINADLQEELKRTGAHRDELMARYNDQEADREIKASNKALRSERARKAAQKRKVAA